MGKYSYITFYFFYQYLIFREKLSSSSLKLLQKGFKCFIMAA